MVMSRDGELTPCPPNEELVPCLTAGVHNHEGYWLDRQRAKREGRVLTPMLSMQYEFERAMYAPTALLEALTEAKIDKLERRIRALEKERER